MIGQDRRQLLSDLANALLEQAGTSVLRVGIDGFDGAGKTIFADELGHILETSGHEIIRASVDGFHHPRATRYQRGKNSPEGYFLDSYDYSKLKKVLLDPLSPAGTRRYKMAVFDHRTDKPVSSPILNAADGSILIFDGIFLHRPELRDYWDFSIFLDVEFSTSIPRCSQRGGGSPDPQSSQNRRYVQGQMIYMQKCDPKQHATLIVNNENLASPYIVR